MKRSRVVGILAMAVLLGLAVFLLLKQFRPKSPYVSFTSHAPSYYAELAHACDSALGAYQPVTNRFLQLSGSAHSLPAPILHLHASEVRIYPSRVWIGFDAGRNSFAILWEPEPEHPKSWRLMTDFDGLLRTVYVQQKP